MSSIIQLEATGERFVKSFDGIISLEHWHRYYLVKKLVENKAVLDIASGEGYGSHLLSYVAKSVIGIDISHEAINFSKQTYQGDNLEYLQGDCCLIPLLDDSVDVIVSFETIEHHDRHEEMLSEIKRVLRPDGLLIMSSPDRYEYNDVPNYDNPHHVKELYTNEFTELLSRYFSNVELADQRVVVGSLIVPRNGTVGFDSLITDTTEPKGVDWSGEFTRPIFNIALASERSLPKFETTLTEFSVEKAKDIIFSDILNKDLIETQKVIIAEHEKKITSLTENISKAEINSLREKEIMKRENEELNNSLNEIHTSKAWKFVTFFHKILNFVGNKNV